MACRVGGANLEVETVPFVEVAFLEGVGIVPEECFVVVAHPWQFVEELLVVNHLLELVLRPAVDGLLRLKQHQSFAHQ